MTGVTEGVMARRRKQTIAVDFDGVIHQYSRGWQDGTIYDPPVEGTHAALERLHRRYKVVIFTTRVNPDMPGGNVQLKRVIDWLEENGFEEGVHFDEVTHAKPPAVVYIDDRALHFTSWDQAMQDLRHRDRLD
jgi:hypothetical protein